MADEAPEQPQIPFFTPDAAQFMGMPDSERRRMLTEMVPPGTQPDINISRYDATFRFQT
jgi:hypothetical protein